MLEGHQGDTDENGSIHDPHGGLGAYRRRPVPVSCGAGAGPGVKRTDLQRHDLSVPGREVVQARVELAPGVTSPKHRHPGEEIVYVLEGSLEYQVEGKPTVTLSAGDVLFIPAETVHVAKNIGGGNGAELATYIVEKGKPLVVPGRVNASLPDPDLRRPTDAPSAG